MQTQHYLRQYLFLNFILYLGTSIRITDMWYLLPISSADGISRLLTPFGSFRDQCNTFLANHS